MPCTSAPPARLPCTPLRSHPDKPAHPGSSAPGVRPLHCQPCSNLPPAADIPRALRSRYQLRARATHTLLSYLPRQTAFPATRYAAVTHEPYARRPRAEARPLGPAPGRLGWSNHVPSREDPQPRLSQGSRPVTLTARGHTPSIQAQGAGLTCGTRAPPAGAWEGCHSGCYPAAFAKFFFLRSYTPGFLYNFCCPTNHFLTCLCHSWPDVQSPTLETWP